MPNSIFIFRLEDPFATPRHKYHACLVLYSQYVHKRGLEARITGSKTDSRLQSLHLTASPTVEYNNEHNYSARVLPQLCVI